MVKYLFQRSLVFLGDVSILAIINTKVMSLNINSEGLLLLQCLISLAYFVGIPVVLNGQTPLMKVFDLKLSGKDGKKITPSRLFLRFLIMQGIFFFAPLLAILTGVNYFTHLVDIVPQMLLLMTVICIYFGKTKVTAWDQFSSSRVIKKEDPQASFETGFLNWKNVFLIALISFVIPLIEFILKK
jgi:uncharacterized RDD family membrane protein YckC